MTTKEQAELTRQRIFELALNLARLRLHGSYVDGEGVLNILNGKDAGRYIEQLEYNFQQEAERSLMRGDWMALQDG